MMEKKTYHYDAFISYRHCDLDKFVAENLHKQLEAYRMPADVIKKRKGMKNKIERVFRDKEELPLTSNLNDPIMNALQNSDWLIVICSPRLRESVWCKKEIETFIALYGREKVLAVLIEGEPAESFPDELLYKKEIITKPDGSMEEIEVPVEPLAADVRGKDKKEVLRKIKEELPRILAAMFYMNYDELRQRHKEQRMKRIMTVSIAGGMFSLILCITFGVIAFYMHEKNNTIQTLSDIQSEQFEELKYQQAVALAEESRRYLGNDEHELAVQAAFTALTNHDMMFTMPYTPQAHGALIESLRCYDVGSRYKAQRQMETVGAVSAMRIAPGRSRIAVADDIARLYLWDLENHEVLATLQMPDNYISDNGFAFVDDNRIVYVSANDSVSIYDVKEKTVVQEITRDYLASVYVTRDGENIVIECGDGYAVYDAQNYALLNVIDKPGDAWNYQMFLASDEDVIAFTRELEADGSESKYVLFADINTGEVISTMKAEDNVAYYENIMMREGIAYAAYDVATEETSEVTTYVCAFDIRRGSIKWQMEIPNCTLKDMEISQGHQAYHLILATTNSMLLVNMENGELVKEASLESTAIEANAYESENVYTVFTENGEFYLIDEVSLTVEDASFMIETNSAPIGLYMNTDFGPVMVPENTNRVINFYTQSGPDMTPVEWEGREYTGNYIWGDEAKEILAGYGATDVDLVSGLYYDTDGQYMFVCYKDRRVSVYEVNGGLLLSNFDVEELPDAYLGTDSAGNTYLGAYNGGYILGPNKELCTYVYGLKDFDAQSNTLYIMDEWGQCYVAPVYTLQELLQMALPYGDIKAEGVTEETSSEG